MRLFLTPVSRFLFLTEQRSRVHSASLCISTLLQLLRELSSTMFLLHPADTVLVQRIQLLIRSRLFTGTLPGRILSSLSSQSVSTMTLQTSLSNPRASSTLLQREQQLVSSGVSALTVLLVQTRTPSRSSVTTPTCMHRLTSHMTPRSQAA